MNLQVHQNQQNRKNLIYYKKLVEDRYQAELAIHIVCEIRIFTPIFNGLTIKASPQ